MKITIWGAGGTGGALARLVHQRMACDIALIDLNHDLAVGKALDIWQTASIERTDSTIIGGSEPSLSAHSDIIVITAGIGRRPGLKREDLIEENADILLQIAQTIRCDSPDAWVIVLTNPADLLARVLVDCGGLMRTRVMAQGGILDSARLAAFTASHLGCSARDVEAMVLGTHGDDMVPLRHGVSIHGIAAAGLIDEVTWAGLVSATRRGGTEIMTRFKSHGAFATPAAAVFEMMLALTAPIPRVLPVSVAAEGHYGIPSGVFIGLPVLLGNRGVAQILDLPLTSPELGALQLAANRLDAQFRAWQADKWPSDESPSDRFNHGGNALSATDTE